MRAIAGDRQTGKTTRLLAWVMSGEKVPGYPGWSRVLLVPDRRQLDLVRASHWERIEDFSHRIYTLDEWRSARNVHPLTEVAIDNVDFDFHRMVPHGRVQLVSFTGESENL